MWQTRPSDLLKIPDDDEHSWERYEIDAATAALVRYVDNKLEEITDTKPPKQKYETVAAVLATAEKVEPVVTVTETPVSRFKPPAFHRNPKKGRRI